jgi:hypothetical protein
MLNRDSDRALPVATSKEVVELVVESNLYRWHQE